MGYTTEPEGKPLPNLKPAMYSHRIHEIQEAAHCAGYAIAVHGSLHRDLDVVAIPWTEHALAPKGLIAHFENLGFTMKPGDPVIKPHSRLAYTILLGGSLFMDLSVMPRMCRPDCCSYHFEGGDTEAGHCEPDEKGQT